MEERLHFHQICAHPTRQKITFATGKALKTLPCFCLKLCRTGSFFACAQQIVSFLPVHALFSGWFVSGSSASSRSVQFASLVDCLCSCYRTPHLYFFKVMTHQKINYRSEDQLRFQAASVCIEGMFSFLIVLLQSPVRPLLLNPACQIVQL